MPRKKQALSRRCPYCRTKFKTTNPRKVYDNTNCLRYAYNARRNEKLRRAAEILQKQAGL